MSSFPVTMFVYGTLMKGFSNHYLLEACKYVGQGRTVSKYSLFTSHYPFVNSTIEGTQIIGELYEIPSQDILSRIDELENHPVDYERTNVSVELIGDDGIVIIAAEIYFNNNLSIGEDTEKVPSGNFHDSITSQKHKVVLKG